MKISIVYVAAYIYKKILGCLRNCSRVSRRGFYRGNTFVNVRPSFPKNYETRNYLCYLHQLPVFDAIHSGSACKDGAFASKLRDVPIMGEH